jgi:hypothetical protein
MEPSDFYDSRFEQIFLFATIMVGTVVAGATIVGSIAFFKTDKGAAKTFSLLIQRAGALQMITVMTIVVGACLLAFAGKISAEGITSILSGIAGYVLGGSSKIGQGRAESSEA